MIKLLWNTTNHQKDPFELKWGKYHEKKTKDWIFYLVNKINYKVINSEEEINQNDVLIIADSGIHFKEKLYKNIKILTKKLFLFHINDEHLDKRSNKIYSYFDHVWRTCCGSQYFANNKIKCIPPGFQSGFKQDFDLEKKRDLKWCFFGTLHKSSRHDMNFQLEKIKPNFKNVIAQFDDKRKSMNVDEMKKIYLNTNFAPCPGGFYHPESYRIYEALQCGTIPIVESIYNYFDYTYPKNPMIKITKWIEAKEIIDTWSHEKILKKRKECFDWWNNYLVALRSSIFEKTNN